MVGTMDSRLVCKCSISPQAYPAPPIRQSAKMNCFHRARYNAEIQLHSLIATCYLRLGNSRLARIYVERIYGPLYSLDRRVNRHKFPLANLKGSPEAYAELLGVAAQISWSHGKWREAFCELHYAKELDSSNSEIQQQRIEYEKYTAKVDARYRAKKKEINKIQQKKTGGMHELLVASQITVASMIA